MKILIVSLVKRKVSPESTAARPRMIYELTKGLLKRGHQVSLLATGDSFIPGAEIIPVAPKALVDLPAFENPFYAHTSFLVKLAKKIEEVAENFDIIHNHTYPECINLLIAEKIKTPMVTTIHAQGTAELDEVLSLFPSAYLISISKAHRKLFKKAKFYKVVYNGIDTSLYTFCGTKENYLLWLGRLSKAKNDDGSFMDPKGVRWAIQLARETGKKLLLSGNVEEREFFEKDVKPYLNEKIKWVGPVSKEQVLTKKQVVELMQRAKAFLMTINWYEPFGLVMAEAMSCGTPVIGFDRGSVSELVVDGKTGFVVGPETATEVAQDKGAEVGNEFFRDPLLARDKTSSRSYGHRPSLESDQQKNYSLPAPSAKNNWQIKKRGLEGLKEALSKIDQINPKDCRQHVINNFSVDKMVENYENVYQEILRTEKV